LMPVLMGGAIVVQAVSKKLEDTGEKRFAIVDRTPGQALFPVLTAAAQERNRADIFDPKTGKQDKPVFVLERVEPSANIPQAIDQQRYELSQRVYRNEFFGFLELGPDVFSFSPSLPVSTGAELPKSASDRIILRYQSNNPTYASFHRWAERVINEEVHRRRCPQPGVPADKLSALLQPVPLLPKGLSKRNPDGTIQDPPTESQIAHYLMPAGLIMLMFMLIMVGATPLMQGVVEEKMQ